MMRRTPSSAAGICGASHVRWCGCPAVVTLLPLTAGCGVTERSTLCTHARAIFGLPCQPTMCWVVDCAKCGRLHEKCLHSVIQGGLRAVPAGVPGPLHCAARGGPAPAPPRLQRVFGHRAHAQLLPGAVNGTSSGAARPVDSSEAVHNIFSQCDSFILTASYSVMPRTDAAIICWLEPIGGSLALTTRASSYPLSSMVLVS